jgi:anthranilate synthase
VLLVDHRDSFVHTLAVYFREQGADMLTLRAGLPGPALDEYAPDLVMPGPARPGRPAEFVAATYPSLYAAAGQVKGDYRVTAW